MFSSSGVGGWGCGHMHRVTLQKANTAPRCQGMDPPCAAVLTAIAWTAAEALRPAHV